MSNLHYCRKFPLKLNSISSVGLLLLDFQESMIKKKFKHHSTRKKITKMSLFLKNINFPARPLFACLSTITAGVAQIGEEALG